MEILLSLRREIPADSSNYGGVGLIKGEYPDLKMDVYDTKQLEQTKEYLEIICEMFYPKPVWYRTCDASTSFMNQLGSNQHFEKNPHFGLRGVRRIIAHPDSFEKEISMIHSVRTKYSNLNILFPFINDVQQYIEASKIARNCKYDGRIGIMAELPSTVLTLDEFIESGVDYIVFGMNDLTDCIDGCSRKNTETNHLIYRDPQLKATRKLFDMITWRDDVEYVLSGDINPVIINLLKKYRFKKVAIPYYQIGDNEDYTPRDIEAIRRIK